MFESLKRMKTRYIIILSVITTALVLLGSLSFYNYEIIRNQDAFNSGYTQGLLYTQSSGNIAYLDNSTGTPTLQEDTIINTCNNILQRQMNNG